MSHEVGPFTLRELKASFLKIIGPRTFRRGVPFSKAQGIMFACPKCYAANDGMVGTHQVICWFADRGVPDELDPKPGRWHPSGSGIADLTFTGPGAASVLLTSGCNWHGFVTNGKAG